MIEKAKKENRNNFCFVILYDLLEYLFVFNI